MRKISVAIPHYNNTKFIKETLSYPINDDRISDIVICDDASSDLERLKEIVLELNSSKIRIIENDKNLGVYSNKIRSLKHCKENWAILLDSDNFFNKDYVDAIYEQDNWENNRIFAPSKSIHIDDYSMVHPNTNFDYSSFVGEINKTNIFSLNYSSIQFIVLMNTCNYFVPVKEFVDCAENHMKSYDLRKISSYDSCTLFTDWLCSNGNITVIDKMKYFHRVHDGSSYLKHQHQIDMNLWYSYCFNKIKVSLTGAII